MKLFIIGIFTQLIFIIFFSSCQKEPSACFDISKQEINVGDTLFFSYCSINDASCSWDFGDGTSSVLERPAKIYDSAGIFKIILTVYTQNGKKTDTLSKTVKVNGNSPSIKISVRDLISLSYIENINVKLFTTFTDWQNMTNPTVSGVTNSSGIITFSNLNETKYYIRAENSAYTNVNLGNAQIMYILTDTLIPNFIYQFTAWVQSKPTPPTSLQVLVKNSESPNLPLQGINVVLYTSYSDWQNFSNPVSSGFTNSSGIVTFNSGLDPIKYFVRAHNSEYSNHQSGMLDQNNISTNVLTADTNNYYTAFVSVLQHPPTALHVSVRTVFPPQSLVPNINVKLFASYTDWQNQSNLIASSQTNASGVAVFNANLNPQQYYVRIENSQLTNVPAGINNPNNVLTQVLTADTVNYYTTFVDHNTQPPTALQVDVRMQGGMQPPVANVTVTLFTTYNDWLNLTNPVASLMTNQQGFVVFTSNLNAIQYYVRAENLTVNNLLFGQLNQNNVLTPTIILYQQNFYTAFVKPASK